MSANVHIHLHVSDLDASRAFYEQFFGEPPVKERPDYVKFLPALGPVNLALSSGALATPRHPTVSHLGIQVASPAEVERQLARVRAAGLEARVETGVDCCHANQDKFWVRDPDGVEWEVYHLNYDLESAGGPAAASACCSSEATDDAAEGGCCAPATVPEESGQSRCC